MAWSCWQADHIEGHLGSDVGVAVPVSADPGAETERGRPDSGFHSFRAQGVVPLPKEVAHHIPVQLIEVVDGVAGLVEWVGLGYPEVVGEPEQLHCLGQAAARVAFGVGIEQLGYLAKVGQSGAAGRFRGMGGKHRPHRHPPDQIAQLGGRQPGRRDGVEGPGQPAAPLPFGAQGAAPVDLLGDVGQMEIGDEGPHQPGGGLDVHAVQEGSGDLAVVPAARPHPLDQVEDLLAFLPGEGVPEEPHHPPDITPHRRIVERRFTHQERMPLLWPTLGP